jgi:hypothetical protein
MNATGLAPTPMAANHGLGHTAAFIYHPSTRVLLIQSNRQSVTNNRVGVYVAADDPANLFAFEPILREDAWERFKDRRIRSLTVRFASPENLKSLDDQGVGVARGARLLADVYDAPTIEISVRAGKSRKHDLPRSKIERTIRKLMGSAADIEAIDVTTAGADDNEIDFLGDSLKASDKLSLSDVSPDENFSVRINWMRSVFRENLPYLKSQFEKS